MLSWRLSTSLHADFCVDALEEALDCYGKPEIFNTDQGSQFTSEDFTKVLLDAEITISMDGKGRWMDNVFIERLWRSLKYEEVYLHAYDTVADAKAGIGSWISFYNVSRPHQALGYRTPTEVFAGGAGAVDRVGGRVAPPVRPHHRANGSVHGGSKDPLPGRNLIEQAQKAPLRQEFIGYGGMHMRGAGIPPGFTSCSRRLARTLRP